MDAVSLKKSQSMREFFELHVQRVEDTTQSFVGYALSRLLLYSLSRLGDGTKLQTKCRS